MNLSDATVAVLEELKRQRVEGRRQIFLEDESLSVLAEHLSGHSSGLEQEISKEDLPSTDLKVEELGVPKMIREESEVVISSDKEKERDFPSPPSISLPDGNKSTQWNWLKEKVLQCEICNRELNPQGKVVFGVGNLDAEIFFCGEAPGAEEEKEEFHLSDQQGICLPELLRQWELIVKRFISEIFSIGDLGTTSLMEIVRLACRKCLFVCLT